MDALGTLEARDLRLVYALVEGGGATRAGRLLHLSQSAISHQLKGLEGRLGVDLFRREGRRLTVSPAGQRLYTLAVELLGPLARVEREVRALSGGARRPLRLSTECFTSYHWLPRALRQLSLEHPQVELKIVAEATGDPMAALRRRELDLALCCSPQAGAGWTRRPLFGDEFVVVMHPRHPLAGRRVLEVSDLVDQPLFLYEFRKATLEQLRRRLFPAGGSFRRVVYVPLTEAILELVRAGLGLSLLAGWSVARSVRAGEVVTARLTRSGLKRAWSGFYQKSSPVRPAIEALLDQLRAQPPGRLMA
jgi:LysR family transcriptional regulator for metE and metH